MLLLLCLPVLQYELVLVETAKPDGSVAKIVYRNGGTVDPIALEKLCGKVRMWLCCFHQSPGAAGQTAQTAKLADAFEAVPAPLRTSSRQQQQAAVGSKRCNVRRASATKRQQAKCRKEQLQLQDRSAGTPWRDSSSSM
jgi:hypothetical protein